MKIGVITYYKVLNFGAALQAVSTYFYLKNNGHQPVFINYQSKESQNAIDNGKDNPQWHEQLSFVDTIIDSQTCVCNSAAEVLKVVRNFGIEAIIIGSDALLQHHSLLSRLKKGTHKPFYLQKISSDRLFPNVFWGVGINRLIPTALMSVSSQNSEYSLFSPITKQKMKSALVGMKYISVRDTWTKNMVANVSGINVSVTPDPVFAFNQNASCIIPNKSEILSKFNLSKDYILLSLFEQVLSKDKILELKNLFNHDGKLLVILPMPTGNKYDFVADKEIKFPLSPIDWYSLLKYSSGYIGSNMHPIVVCLHNAIPCFSLDIWGRTNFFNRKINDDSSKVKHIMDVFGVTKNYRTIDNGRCEVHPEDIYNNIINFPVEEVKKKASLYLDAYNKMMQSIIEELKK